jgi:hypothetical protein
LLLSAERHARPHTVVVFDLGLSAQDRCTLSRRFPLARVQPFAFREYPAHLARLETCAWKPIAIDETIRRESGLVLWLDAATIIRAPLEEAFAAIARDGVLTLAGQSPVVRWCHPLTLDLMNVPEEDRRKRCRIGGVIGFDGGNAMVRSLVAAWRDASLNADVLNPPGARRDNHRWDQALLTNVLYAFDREHGLVLRADEADIGSIHPVRWVSTRNKVATWIPVAADPLVRAFYAVWKGADRVWLRASQATCRADSYRRASRRTTRR